MVDQPAIQYVVEEAVRAGLLHYVRQGDPRGLSHAVRFGARPDRGGPGPDQRVRLGEIQLTDALQTLATSDADGGGAYGVLFKGRRYDTGDKLSYLKAVISIASERVEFGEELRTWMKAFVS